MKRKRERERESGAQSNLARFWKKKGGDLMDKGNFVKELLLTKHNKGYMKPQEWIFLHLYDLLVSKTTMDHSTTRQIEE